MYDADKFADWLKSAYKDSPFKSYADLAKDAGVTRSAVSALMTAKKQPLTGKPSRPLRETVIALGKSLKANINEGLRIAGHSGVESEVKTVQIDEETGLALYASGDIDDYEWNDLVENVKALVAGKKLQWREKNQPTKPKMTSNVKWIRPKTPGGDVVIIEEQGALEEDE